jgi:hypothetical protein
MYSIEFDDECVSCSAIVHDADEYRCGLCEDTYCEKCFYIVDEEDIRKPDESYVDIYNDLDEEDDSLCASCIKICKDSIEYYKKN